MDGRGVGGAGAVDGPAGCIDVLCSGIASMLNHLFVQLSLEPSSL